ncbi:MAG TPA: serine hydrolase domain-containing protein [Stellaceae bacterium]|nr:serine hydrolase domain-containing protein [Stellaceae bacterium]
MPDLDLLLLQRRVAALLTPWADGGTPGVTVGVVRGGALVLHDSAGLASLELGVPIGPDTCFRIASVSKQFTCAAILMLEAEGRLRLSDNVREHLPEVPDMGAPVTIAQLMHNSSGVRDMLEIMRQGGAGLGHPCGTADLLAGICRQRKLNFAPDSRFLYSNSNFLLLGLIVEKLTGEALGGFLERRIFAPLGMTRTRMTPDPQSPVPGLATGYLPQANGFIRAPHGFALGGEGGLVSCVEDLALWERNFTTGRVGGGALTEALQRQAPFTNGVPNLYARGLRVDAHRGFRTISHGGLWPGYRTEFLRVAELDLAVIAIANHGGIDPAALVHQVLDVLIEGKPGIHPVPPMPARSALEPLVGCWVDREAGATLDITLGEDGAPVITIGGAPLPPQATEDGRLVVTHGTILLAIRQVGGDTLEIEQDAGHIAAWHRVAPGAVLPRDLAGGYASDEMAATWRFVETDGAMRVHVDGPIARGAVWDVTPVEDDLFRVSVPSTSFRAWYDVRLRRDAEGAAAGLLVSSNRLKDVAYARAVAPADSLPD